MGFPKALMPIGSATAMEISQNSIKAIYPHRILVTLPPSLWIRRAMMMDDGIEFALNSYPHLGYSGSIKTALKHWGENVDGIMFSPVDSPLFCQKLLIIMNNLANHLRDEPAIIVPTYRERRGHPVYFSRHFFSQLVNAWQVGGPREIMAANRKQAIAISWPDVRILLNLNHQRDMDQLLGIKSKPALRSKPMAVPETSICTAPKTPILG